MHVLWWSFVCCKSLKVFCCCSLHSSFHFLQSTFWSHVVFPFEIWDNLVCWNRCCSLHVTCHVLTGRSAFYVFVCMFYPSKLCSASFSLFLSCHDRCAHCNPITIHKLHVIGNFIEALWLPLMFICGSSGVSVSAPHCFYVPLSFVTFCCGIARSQWFGVGVCVCVYVCVLFSFALNLSVIEIPMFYNQHCVYIFV